MDINVLHNLTYGMFIVSSKRGEIFNAQVSNTVFQVTSEPITIAASINKQNLTHEFIMKSSIFSVSVLSENTPLEFIQKFGFKSGRIFAKFEGVGFKVLPSGCPVILDNCVCYLENEVINSFDCGTHTLFQARVTDMALHKNEKPLTYECYQQTKRGTTPKTAPTYIKIGAFGDDAGSADLIQKYRCIVVQKYRCGICGYVYNPEAGDPQGLIVGGTLFQDIPNTWVCPVCSAEKSKFVPCD